MKHSISFLSILVILAFVGCSKSINIPYQRTGEVSSVNHERAIIKVQSSSKASNDEGAINYAERQAFENILFKGIPNSNQEVALIATESKAWANNKAVMESLIINGGYLQYIISSKTVDLVRQGGVSFVKQNVEIDLAALRKYLVSEKVIKKFGL